MFSTGDAEHAHALVVIEAREELGGDEEVLAGMFAAGDLDHAVMDHALVARIHTLVDLIYDAERCLCHRLERHEVEDGGDCTLATGLAVLVELLEGLIFPG